jgi:hypothetical protein
LWWSNQLIPNGKALQRFGACATRALPMAAGFSQRASPGQVRNQVFFAEIILD